MDAVTLAAANAAAAKRYGRRVLYNVADYLDTGDTLAANTDVGAAVNRAIAAAAADSSGKPGQVFLPPMNKKVSTIIAPVSGVDIIGSGTGKTILRPQAMQAAIQRGVADGATSGSPLRDVLIAGLELDGSEQAGTYQVFGKGTYLQYTLRVKLQHLYVHDIAASGIGNDYNVDGLIDDVIAINCGRLNGGTGAGGAGIGIGTSGYSEETLTVRNCVTKNNARCGLFFETQASGVFSGGAQVVGHYSSGNGEHGIADAGCTDLVVIGGRSVSNTKSGFAAYGGTVSAASPGQRGLVTGLDVANNTLHGIHYDASVRSSTFARYAFRNIRSATNAGNGVYIQAGTSVAVGSVTIASSEIHSNAIAGVNVLSGGAAVNDLVIEGNRIYNNGTNTGSSMRQAIRIQSSLTRPRIKNNKCYDDAGSNQQYGLQIDAASTITNGEIADNDLRSNVAGALNLLGTLTGTIVRSNAGYNPQGPASIAVGASPFTYTGGPTPEVLYIDGGTVSTVVKGGSTLRTATNATVHLGPNESVTVTYSAAPTMTRDRQ